VVEATIVKLYSASHQRQGAEAPQEEIRQGAEAPQEEIRQGAEVPCCRW